MFRKKTSKHDPAPVEQTPEPKAADGLYFNDATQTKLKNLRSQREIVQVRTDRNWWRVGTMIAGIVAGGAILGWYNADVRYENSVRVIWVKMYPNGQTQVEYWDDDANPNRWHQATINSKLIDYIEHRYRKHKETIASDYGFVLPFMGEEMQQEFTGKDGYNAAKVAADYEANPGPRVDVKVRALDHNTVDTPDAKNNYTATVETTGYITLKSYGVSVRPTCDDKIVKLLWTMRPVAEIPKDPENPYLKVNPLGIKLISGKLLDDVAQGGTVKCEQ